MLYRGIFFLAVSVTMASAQTDWQSMLPDIIKNLLNYIPGMTRSTDLSYEIDPRQANIDEYPGEGMMRSNDDYRRMRQSDLNGEDAAKRAEDLSEAARERFDRMKEELEELARKREEDLEAAKRHNVLTVPIQKRLEELARKREEDLEARKQNVLIVPIQKRLEELARKREEDLEAAKRHNVLTVPINKRLEELARKREEDLEAAKRHNMLTVPVPKRSAALRRMRDDVMIQEPYFDPFKRNDDLEEEMR
ncbi:unnamed protein product [Phyllotreta striolata]|uniref:Uncharacterized protein n=1 Tax=Phyllotreta striolata TaxID=444603 RepID=A0A9N9TJ21_PHYSR|nr:unnamed protein product [Phyllotreta striolata]